MRTRWLAFLLIVVLPRPAGAGQPLWEIGRADGQDAEFALAPGDYGHWADDGFFVVGYSQPKNDWPYVHPGPSDGWAGSQAHAFKVIFALARPVASGECRLRLDLVDTHYKSPPQLRIAINGTEFLRSLPIGGTGEAIRGPLSEGKPYRLEIEFRAALLRAGRNDVSIETTAGSWMLYDAVSLEAPAEAELTAVPDAAALVAQAHAPSRVEQVVVVFKTHFDIGYTDLAANVVQRYRTEMIDRALEVVDQNRDLPPAQQFVWTIPGWPMHQILDWPEQTPERRGRVEQALTGGRFVVHALPFTTHTELLELEDLVRGMGYASRITRRLGLPLARDAKMTDVPEHTWALATLLHHAGVQFMHIGCNGMSYSPHVPPVYWWEGPDGSRLLTMYSPQYGTGLLPPRDWPYKTWLALLHTGDNHGPPRPEEVKSVLEKLAGKLPGVKVRIGRLSDFAAALLAEQPELPVVRGDTPDTWIHGPLSDPIGAGQARRIRPALAAAEALNTQLRAWGVKVPDAAPTLSAAYEQSLLYGEHTWGGSIGWIVKQNHLMTFGDEFLRDRADGRFERSEASWEEHSGYIREALRLGQPLLDDQLRGLAGSVAVDGPRVVVYNPLPWKRAGTVALAWPQGKLEALRPAEGGEPIPVSLRGGEADFVASDVPAMGYRTYVPAPAPRPATSPRSETTTIESPRFRVELDPSRGGIRSLVDKRSGRELADAGGPFALGQFLYQRFDQDQVRAYCHEYLKKRVTLHADFDKPGLPPASKGPAQQLSPHDFHCQVSETAGRVEACMTADGSGPLPKQIVTRVILSGDLPWVDLAIEIHDKPLEPWPEAGWICLPFKVPQPQFRVGRLGSIIDPARDIIPGANRDVLAVNTGVAIRDAAGLGVGFCPLDAPLVSLDRPGMWQFSLDFVPQHPVAFVNLFNNQWNTNFRLWNGGSWTARVRIWAADGPDDDQALITPSLEARVPLVAQAGSGPGGRLAPAARGLELSRRGVQVTALGDNPDGPGTVLRLWELSGKGGPCRVRLPAGIAPHQLQPVNLRGEPAGEALPVERGEFEIVLAPFAPASFTWSP